MIILVLRYVYLPSSNREQTGILLILLLQRKREKGVSSPVRQIFYRHVVFGLFFLFEIAACSLVVTS